MIDKYLDWLSKGETQIYFLITLFLMGLIITIIVNILIFITDTIDKNKKVEELEEKIKKMEKRKK